jgi:serine/threonine-protein kinase
MTAPRVVGGRYELGELIGYGGMAEVHRGRDIRLGRDVAIKLLRSDLARDPSFLHRFRREAQAAAGLNHPSIVAVYDTGEDIAPDGTPQPFIVMEYVEGRTLRDVIKAQGHLPARRAMEITADVCGALDFSHRSGIVHRDIKPANVMITQAGAVKVMDFGIARAVADNAATVTQTANVIGTAQYLSPEQARGEAVDARSDVYSTGCLLYELVTGSPPFQGDSPVAVAYQHVRESPPPPSSRNAGVPPAVDSIVMKALAKNQLNRYQSAGEMRADIQRALANQPVMAESVMTDAERTQFMARTPAPPVALRRPDDGPAPYPEDRRSGLVWALITLALLLVIGLGAFAIVKISGRDNTKSVPVPNVIGQLASAAETNITNAGLVPIQGDPTSGTCNGGQKVTEGQVCTVDQPIGSMVKAGSNVTYHLYEIAKASVPQVQGLSFSEASNQLTGLQFKVVRKDANNSAAADTVLSVSPAAGTSLPVGATVTLTVSTGKVVLPDVKGLTYDAAKAKLNALGFTSVNQSATTESTTNPGKDGLVADDGVSPTPGIAYVPATTSITLTVYQYTAPPTTSCPPPSSSSAPGTGTPTSTPTATATTC